MKKYILTDEVKRPMGLYAYRIKAIRDFDDVKEGDLGGFVTSEDNLSHEDNCWIYSNAMALGKSKVDQNAKLFDESKVYDSATVSGNAKLYGASEAFGHSTVFDNVKMFANSRAYGRAEVFGNSQMADVSKASQDAWVCGDAMLTGESHATEKTTKTPINLSGLDYNVTIMDNHISVNCVTKTIDEWINKVTTEELLQFDGRTAVRFYRKYKDMLTVIANTTRESNTNLQ